MATKKSSLFVGLCLVFLVTALPLCAQQQQQQAQQSSIDDLKKEIQALSESVKAMQKDLQDIKAMLQSRAAAMPPAPPPPPESVLLDLGNSPFRGDPAAKLILVEFSDYQ